jgi:hypothetical protein
MSLTANLPAPRLAMWDQVAGVRSKPRRFLGDRDPDADQDRLYFSPELMPVLHHPRVVALGEEVQRQMLIERLYQYLDVTTWVEQGLVNQGLVQLFQARLPLRLPSHLEFDAYKIYCDEGYHALCSVDLKHQVAEETGISWPVCAEPRVLRTLDGLAHSVPAEMRGLAQLFFVVVYETLISGILARVPRDRRVVETVRRVVLDHAEDEGQHHAYFSDIFRRVWPGLEPEQRDAIGPLLAPAIVADLEPDVEAIDALLARTGLDQEERRAVIADAHPTARVQADIRRAAAATINLVRSTGGFDHLPTRAAFLACDLVPA